MKHNIIKTDNHLLVVDDSEIKEGDWVIFTDKNLLYKVEYTSQCFDYNNDEDCKKIIAHLPLNDSPMLEGVPLLPPMEEDVWSMGLEERLNELPYTKHLDDGMFNDGQVSGFELGAEWGYNKAREKYKFTEKDLWIVFNYGRSNMHEETFESVIKRASQPKTPTHFKFETVCDQCLDDDSVDSCYCHHGSYKIVPKTITNSQGQTQVVGRYIYE